MRLIFAQKCVFCWRYMGPPDGKGLERIKRWPVGLSQRTCRKITHGISWESWLRQTHFLELQRLGDQREHEVPLARPLHICHACHACHDILPFIFGCNTRDCGWWRKLACASWNCFCFRKESTDSKPPPPFARISIRFFLLAARHFYFTLSAEQPPVQH